MKRRTNQSRRLRDRRKTIQGVGASPWTRAHKAPYRYVSATPAQEGRLRVPGTNRIVYED